MRKYRLASIAIATAGMMIAGNAFAAASDVTNSGAVMVADQPGVPGGVMVNTIRIEAEVLSVDHQARTMELKMEDGTVNKVRVGPEAVNFKQLEKGDVIQAEMTEEIAVSLAEEGDRIAESGSVAAVAAAEGEKPGALVIGTVQVPAVILGIVPKYNRVLLGFEDGSEKLVTVRDDIDLTVREAGEVVIFNITEMVALSVKQK